MGWKEAMDRIHKAELLHCLGIRQHHEAMGGVGIWNEVACGYSGLCQLLAL